MGCLPDSPKFGDASVCWSGTGSANDLNPACRLPAEILSHIFLVQENIYTAKDCRYPRADWKHRTWTQVTHVCRYWRAVALGCCSLWTNLHFGTYPTPQLEQMFALSKDAPLKITVIDYQNYCDILKRSQHPLLLKSLSCIGRLLHVSIDLQPATNSLFLKLKDLQELPPLETLFTEWTNGPGPLSQLESLELTLRAVAPEIQPVLRKPVAEHSRCSVHHAFNAIPGLQVEGSAGRPTYLDTFNAIRQMPLLQSLDLDNSIPLPDSLPLDFVPLSIPSLQSVDICDKFEPVVHFLKAFHFPEAKTMVELDIFDEGVGEVPWQQGFKILASTWQNQHGGSHRLQSLRISRLKIELHFASHASPQQSLSQTPNLTLKVEQFEGSDVPDFSSDFLCTDAALNWESLTALEVDYDVFEAEYDFGRKDTWKFYAALPNIETVTFVGTALHVFLRAFSGDPASDQLSEACFPRLSTIKLCGISGPCDGKMASLPI
ncbi:hypothetical protein NMY22_g10077 [Coprinellus aureogranulatus]|nr:hypothetical protein NMY22_g10077 [Coprinellus aureogranulatus]